MSFKEYLLTLKNSLIEKEKLNESQNLTNNNMFLCKASEIGKIIVNKCLDKGIEINTQKLHKLLVLVQAECIKDSGFPLFSESIEIWECGVVIKEVDEDFRAYGVSFYEHLDEKIVLLHSEIEYINNILGQYGKLSSYDLNQICLNQEVIFPKMIEKATIGKVYKK